MKLYLYNEFFRHFVLRKRQELVNPRFINIGEIVLPKLSQIHYIPKSNTEYGPPTSEPFISNFPKDVFINFYKGFNPVIGNGHAVPFDQFKAIKAYRNSHFNYNWTRNIDTVYNREGVLVVENYALMEKSWTYRPSLFVNFEKSYNQLRQVITGINTQAAIGKRKQFLRLELPINIPAYIGLVQDYGHYVKSFNAEGLPNVNKQAIRLTKAEGCYWLLDWYAFLMGQSDKSLFGLLTKEALDDLHLIFTFNSKALVVNMGVIKGWFDELKDQTKRTNATKRFYLALRNLSKGGNEITEAQLDNGEESDDKDQGRASTSESESLDDRKAKHKERAEERVNESETEDVSSKNAPVASNPSNSSILDVFGGDKGDDSEDLDSRQSPGSSAATSSDDATLESWDSEVDDKLLEDEQVNEQTQSMELDKDVFKNPTTGIERALNERAKDGSLTVAEQEFFVRKGQRYESIEMPNGQTMEEFIKISDTELKDLGGEIKGDFITVLDESMLRSRATSLKRDYVKKFLQKDIASMVLGIQNAGICINDFKPELIRNVEGAYYIYALQMHPVGGSQSTRYFRIPHVEDDGTFMVDGVKQHMQGQRVELPIRKINASQVALTSYYDNKLMVSRSDKVVNDYGRWLLKQIRLQASTGELNISNGNVYDKFMKCPRIYSILSQSFKTIKSKNITFDFDYWHLIEKYPDFKNYNKVDKFLVGVKADKPLWVDDFSNVYHDDKVIGTVEGLLGINMTKCPLEQVVMNISGYQFPIGVVLCYYFGIDELIKVIKATTRSVPMGTRPSLTEDEFAIAFSDEYLIFNKRERLTTLIFSGLIKLNNISNFTRSDLNNRGVWVPLMGDAKVKPKHFIEMNNIFDLFIDPITRAELKRLNYPVSIHYLLIEAVKLLLTDYTRHEVEIEEQRIAGYERFAGHIYSELVKSVRQFRNKGNDRKHTMDLNPESIILNIITDTSVNLVEEVNPVHQIKDQEEITFGGTKGRSEVSMVKRTRGQLESYTGIVSEANKDNAKVGFVTYLVSDPRIADFRGNIDLKGKNTQAGLASVTGNLQYGMTLDDPKRVSFQSTQASQAVSAANYRPNVLRTGYDNIIAHRTSELYSKIAKQDGTVTDVTKDAIQVTYKDGSTDSYPLGLVIGEASGEYHRHTRITDLKVGQAFKEGDVIGWDEQWFERDMFCPGQVAWKCGKVVRIALTEDQGVFEDSLEISSEFAEECVTPYIKCKSFMIDQDQALKMFAKVGDNVGYDTILCDVEDAHLAGVGEIEEGFEGVNRFGIRQIKSHHHGKIVEIKVVYNAKYEDMSPSVKSYVQTADRERARLAKLVNAPVTTGSVSSNLSVKKQSIMPGKVKIMVYIEAMDSSVSADKYVVGNQMKGTVGRKIHKTLRTEDGRKVDVKFSFKSLFNRMVLSLRNKLIACELATHVTKRAIDIYRGRE